MNSPRRKLIGLAVALPIVLVVATAWGTIPLSLEDWFEAFAPPAAAGSAESADARAALRTIVWDVRLPRVLLVALVGGTLAVVGAALQAAFHNPMADTGVIGASGGAAFGAVLALQFGWAEYFYGFLPLAAFAGALVTVFLVYRLASWHGPASATSLLLTGMALQTLAGSLITIVLLHAAEYRMRELLFWLQGGAEGRSWVHLSIAAAPALVGTGALWLLQRPMDAMLLGGEQALAVGVSVVRTRNAILFWSALAAGAAVSVTGAIAFVGLMVPHILRRWVGSAARFLLPACWLAGGSFLMLCDLTIRLLARWTEVQVGTVTTILGVPFLLALLVTERGREEG